ncbi:MAG: penicillin-binding protein, partial [Prevotella sp.]|nr:penicillin-binding protein [Prevotella sp.]
LGPCEISVAEMVSAYTAFVNHGIRSAPLLVTQIRDNDGNIIAQFQPRLNEVISEESANKMLYMLKGVVDGGTAGRLRFKYNLKGEMGGKTGTTNKNSDAWFMGITPTLVTGVWVGGDDRDIHFDTMQMGQGATMALPIFAYYMRRVYADPRLGYTDSAIFDLPPGYDPCSAADDGGEMTTEEELNDIEEIYE